MLWDEPKIFFLERRYFFSIILSEFLKNRVALQPFGKFPLPFLTLVKGENIRQQNSGDVLDLMLRDAAVVGELFPPAQVAPPKKYLPQLSPVRRRNGVLSVFCRLCLFSLRILPLSYLKMKTQPPVKPFGPSASAWCPESEIVF